MFKKLLTTISVAAVLAVSASAANVCKDGVDRFLGDKLFELYKKYNKHSKEAFEATKNWDSPESYGAYRGLEKVANFLFRRAGISDNYVTFLSKQGIKTNIDKTQIYINYLGFFEDYLYNKLKNMPEEKRRIFLEKLYFFSSRPPAYIAKLGVNNAVKELLFYSNFFNLLSDREITDYEKSVLDAGGNFLWTLRQTQKPLMNTSKDPQVGGAADNIRKFFMYAATKQYQKAYNLIDRTYPDSFIEKFNKLLKEHCKIKN